MSDEAPPSSASESSATQPSDTSNGGFTFFFHSQESLNDHLPPNSGDKSGVRQKRRRTSPEDHAILEAEYQRNPKPDKAARMIIVEKVALGEKEVQIWFQNRRQNTRRKSRPFVPHDIPGAFGQSMDDTDLLDHSKFLSDHSNACQFPSLQSQSQSTNWTASEISNQNTTDNGLALNFPKPLGPSDPVPPHVDSGPSNQIKLGPSGMQSGLADAFDSSQKCAFEKIISFDGHVPSLADAQPPSACPGYLSNRRSVPSALRSSISQPSLQPSLNSAEQQSGSRGLSEKYLEAYPPLKRTSSFVRLSMSLDGKAKVTINNDNSPSPPRIQPSVLSAKTSRSGPLQRSQSAIEPGDRPKENQNMAFIPWPRRTISGRSRDARAWEFYCDSDARNALTEHAEQEQSGSAVGAIALMRSRTKNMLASNKNKRNLQTSKAETVKRVKASGFSKTEKPKLYRSSSSTARLQSVSGENRKQQSNSKNQIPKDGTKSVIFRSPSGDSDKENWEPGSHTGNSRRRQVPRVQCNTQRPILKENPRIPSQSSSLGAVLNRENMTPGRDRRKAADSAEEDGEVAAFMGESSVRREEEDLDCVQNLLSLSQGAWR